MSDTHDKAPIARRFRGFLPIVIDVETGGFNPKRDALLEIAAVLLDMDEQGIISRKETISCIKDSGCSRAVLVGHNAAFDLAFVNAAVDRTRIKRNPFHPFSTFDTVSLAALAFGQTVLARAVKAAGIDWNSEKAHSAVYDTEKTADLFCTIINQWNDFSLKQADLFCTIINQWNDFSLKQQQVVPPIKATEGL
jgi:ribonuclease T